MHHPQILTLGGDISLKKLLDGKNSKMSDLSDSTVDSFPFLVFKTATSTWPAEIWGAITAYCDLDSVTMLLCSGDKILLSRLCSERGVRTAQCFRAPSGLSSRIPPLLSQLKGLKQVYWEFSGSSARMPRLANQLLEILPPSVVHIALNYGSHTAQFQLDLIANRLKTLQAFQVIHGSDNARMNGLSPEFLANMPTSSLTKLNWTDRSICPWDVFDWAPFYPVNLTDLTLDLITIADHQSINLRYFSNFSSLVRLCLPYSSLITFDSTLRQLPESITHLDLRNVTSLNDTAFFGMEFTKSFFLVLPINLKVFHFSVVHASPDIPWMRTLTTLGIHGSQTGLGPLPPNITSLTIRWGEGNPSIPPSFIERFPTTLTELNISNAVVPVEFFEALPNHLIRISIDDQVENVRGGMVAYQQPWSPSLTTSISEKIDRDSLICLAVPLPSSVTRLAHKSNIWVRVPEIAKERLKWDFVTEWVSPLLVVVHDRLDLMYRCFEYGWYVESDFETWSLFLNAIKHGSLKFLKWVASRRLLRTFSAMDVQTSYKEAMVISTAIHHGQMGVIEWLETTSFNLTIYPSPQAARSAIKWNNPKILEWMTAHGAKWESVVLTGASTLLREALKFCAKNSVDFLRRIGLTAIDYSMLFHDCERDKQFPTILNFTESMGVWRCFETSENSEKFLQFWQTYTPAPQDTPKPMFRHVPPCPPPQRSLIQDFEGQPPLKFRFATFLTFNSISSCIGLLEWLEKHDYLNPTEEFLWPNTANAKIQEIPISQESQENTVQSTTIEPSTSDSVATLLLTPTATTFGPTKIEEVTKRTILSFYLEHVNFRNLNSTPFPVEKFLQWFADRDPTIFRVRFGAGYTLSDFRDIHSSGNDIYPRHTADSSQKSSQRNKQFGGTKRNLPPASGASFAPDSSSTSTTEVQPFADAQTTATTNKGAVFGGTKNTEKTFGSGTRFGATPKSASPPNKIATPSAGAFGTSSFSMASIKAKEKDNL